MAEIVVDGIRKTFRGSRDTTALQGVSFDVEEGDLLVLLGPSGCGKTTTLRCLAGLETPDDGRICFGDRVMYDKARRVRVPTQRRPIGLVFQSYALWPHMSARRNIEYPLRAARVPKAKRVSSVEKVAHTVDLDEALLDKRPGQLSGGQQQRVSLARALVREAEVVLFDEPLSNLDASLREQLRAEIHALHARLGFTGIYVTHDLTEAIALGDRIAVMQDGQIAQLGSPEAVFEQPADIRTAHLVGLRHFLSRGPLGVEEGLVTGDLPAPANRRIDMLVRPERLRISQSSSSDAGVVRLHDALVTDVAYVGTGTEVSVQHACGTYRIQRAAADADAPRVGDTVAVDAPIEDVRCYDGESGRLNAGTGRATQLAVSTEI